MQQALNDIQERQKLADEELTGLVQAQMQSRRDMFEAQQRLQVHRCPSAPLTLPQAIETELEAAIESENYEEAEALGAENEELTEFLSISEPQLKSGIDTATLVDIMEKKDLLGREEIELYHSSSAKLSGVMSDQLKVRLAQLIAELTVFLSGAQGD